MEKKTRNRQKKPQWSFSGLDLSRWQADTKRINWAQTTPEFRDILTVLTNERSRALATPLGLTENRILGRAEGYEEALKVLRLLATHEPVMPSPEGVPTYPSPMESEEILTDQPFNNY